MKIKIISTVLLFLVAITSTAQNSIVIPPRKDNSGITQVYQKKRQQVVAKQKTTPQPSAPAVTKVQGICVSQVVDLGLSVKWAGWNLGANSTEQKGGYYGWADPEGINRSKDMNQYPSANPPGSISGTRYDTARKMWGSNWRMPNAYEMLELYNECKWEWMTFKGVYGAKITGPNGNAIFLPAAGCREGYEYDAVNEECTYWAGSLDPTDPSGAFCVAVEREGNSIDREFYPEDRHLGLSIRPVYDSGMPMIDLDPEDFQRMGMAGVDNTIATLNITAISSYQNGKWSNWDNNFRGTFVVKEFTDSKTRTIYLYMANESKPFKSYIVKNWGNQQDKGGGEKQNSITCTEIASNGSMSDVSCILSIRTNGLMQFVCPIDGTTYSFSLTE